MESREGIEHLTKAVSGLPHENSSVSDELALYFEALAEAYLKSGDFGIAREEFEKIAALTTGRHIYGDIYARSYL